MSNYAGLGNCTKCGMEKIAVNEAIKCIRCDMPAKPLSGLVVNTEDPGEDKISHVLAASGVGIPKIPKKEQKEVAVVKRSFEEEVKHIADQLRSLPIPRDIKQFKAVNRAIKSVEKILGEQNAN